MFPMRGRRYFMLALGLAAVLFFVLVTDTPRRRAKEYLNDHVNTKSSDSKVPHPNYLPKPTYVPPPVKDPFPALATSTPPPIPQWNIPRKNMHKEYDVPYAPPLFIGFTRTWPILLQAVVSYIAAGWPPAQIYVVENTGVQMANKEGRLTLQNPFYLNHTQLKKLGVNVVQAPVLMNFAQLQNFYTFQSYKMEAPYYFWSHMDVLALSYEDGMEGVTPKASEEGYKTIYELCLQELGRVIKTDERWADKFFAYDHLTLVNRAAYEDVGGWDTFIPYYMNDCDMHSRLLMHNWTQLDVKAGIITDVSATLDDLVVLYRDELLEPTYTDPNPPPPKNEKWKRDPDTQDEEAAAQQEPSSAAEAPNTLSKRGFTLSRKPARATEEDLELWRKLQKTADHMFHHKHGDRGRNTWQMGQQGGGGEPFYYPARGIVEATDVLTEAGREVFRRKWGHRDCDLIGGAGLQLEDQWKVAKDWKD